MQKEVDGLGDPVVYFKDQKRFKDNNRAILITDTEALAKEDYNLSEEQLMNKFKNKIVIVGLSEIDSTADLKRGEKVKVWFHTRKESNPPSATIQQYKLLQKNN
ncbi:DUF3221 domain-containing protein [Bacillus subtilis]|nr:DUF3221 domain-containing protein [Bacillus subtilis]